MVRRLLGFGIVVLAIEFALAYIYVREHVSLAALVLFGIAIPFLILLPAIQFLPRHCVVCGKRTRRAVPFFQCLKEYFRIGGAAPHCSAHSNTVHLLVE